MKPNYNGESIKGKGIHKSERLPIARAEATGSGSPNAAHQPCLGFGQLHAGTNKQTAPFIVAPSTLASRPGPSIFVKTEVREAIRSAQCYTCASQKYGAVSHDMNIDQRQVRAGR